MKTLGLIGGIGPESTIDYYRMIIERYRARTNGENPAIILNSIDLNRIIAWMNSGELNNVADYCSQEIERLVRAGAEVGAICSNTPHIVFDELRARANLPLISIVESTRDRVRTLGLKTVALFGTRFTMQAPFYPTKFAEAGIKLVTPNDEEQTFIHDSYMKELLSNQFLPETRAQVLHIADELKTREKVEAIILGGTELPLLIKSDLHHDLPLLDTASIHVDALVQALLN